jgi:hypothetical protein
MLAGFVHRARLSASHIRKGKEKLMTSTRESRAANGLSHKAVANISEALRRLLADVFALYIKT